MSSYPVVWRHGEDGPLLSGRLELTENALRLRGGGDRRHEKRLAIPYSEILGVERGPEMRIGRCRAITIVRHNTAELLVASIGGIGLLNEIFAVIQQALTG